MVVERTASFGKLHLKGIVASVGLTAGLLVLIFPLPELESPARIQLALTLGAIVLGKRSDAGPNYGHAVYGATAHHELL